MEYSYFGVTSSQDWGGEKKKIKITSHVDWCYEKGYFFNHGEISENSPPEETGEGCSPDKPADPYSVLDLCDFRYKGYSVVEVEFLKIL